MEYTIEDIVLIILSLFVTLIIIFVGFLVEMREEEVNKITTELNKVIIEMTNTRITMPRTNKEFEILPTHKRNFRKRINFKNN